MNHFYSHGKLLVSGEYLVLDGAKALALPTRFGQSLRVNVNSSNILKWTSLDSDGSIWFETRCQIRSNGQLEIEGHIDPFSQRLVQILQSAKELNPDFISGSQGYDITTELEFPKDWGLGTSSTLINNIANWAQIDPYQLLASTFGGSGYDIACARATRSLVYQLDKNRTSSAKSNDDLRNIADVNFNPDFKAHLYFVYLNKKQNSRQGIAQYKSQNSVLTNSILEVNRITEAMICCMTLHEFQKLMDQHETLISEVIRQKPVKQLLFPDFDGSIKSLGAWGGDFVMVATETNPVAYFKTKGYNTILKYSEMVKS